MTLRSPIRCDAEDILNLKAGRPGSSVGAVDPLHFPSWAAADRMAEEAAVAVCVRVRPLNSREEELGEASHIYWKTDKNAIYQSDGGKSFQFDRVFHSNETTKNVYEEIAVPIISSAIQGYNGTIFAYGQTASGKTHTMMGSEDCLGVIPRAIHDIFQRIKKFPEREFLLRVSYMEIYNETITDLLCNTQKVKPLIIREDINRNVYVADLTEEVVYTAEMALKWLATGEKNRHYGITKMNQRSSRSHTIFRMILESREKAESSNCDGSIKVSHLNLVDLAGSERAAQTGAEGMRLKEGCYINRNLLILGQVIKKLSDGQVGGFINYRDSKLTRILQNSLGGNAKTRIICTITPASLDETLTTLQFASTAKYMKNTPYVNEVSNDEALLKRYRREIVDLKKQLEEVNTKTRAQEIEKDQLAQLLDEKDLLQKVQDEKIQNLKRMLVTSSSIALQQELEIKKKRRVTWCFGKMKDSNYVKEFKIPTNITTRTRKTSVTPLRENSLMKLGESALSWESEVFDNTLEPLAEAEWSSATALLSEENLESELTSLNTQYNNLVLDYEQLRRENEDLKLKLKEKNELEEFEFLEQREEKDQELQLMHEVSNLKNLIKHAEEYNQDLENELSSKVELLKEKEDQIKELQRYIDAQKSETTKTDLSYSSEATEDLKQAMRTLSDLDTVALDAKRESAFLRSENLELKERINELSDSCKQMENGIQMYQRQLEAKKQVQADLEKELQLAFQEISKLSALVDGKGLLSNLELEKRITDLQKELNKEVEEKETLQKEVHLLSELKSLPSEVETLRRELHEKSEELCVITTEREKLFSEMAHKDSRIQGLLEEIGNTKDDLAASQLSQRSSDEECQALKSLHVELKHRQEEVLEESERVKQELSQKTQELAQKTAEGQEMLNQMEELREKLERRDSSLQSAEKEKNLLTEKLQQTLEEVRALTQEKNDLKQLQESLQTERDQLRSDIQDTVNMNIDTQEQLLNALESLKQHQETINMLKMKATEEMSDHLPIKGREGSSDEVEQKLDGIDEENLLAESAHTVVGSGEDHGETEEQRKIDSLLQENSRLQQTLESIIAEKEQLKMDLKENIEMSVENQEELRILRDELKRQQEIAAQEKDHVTEKSEELSRAHERLAEIEEKLKEKNQKLQETQQQLVSIQEAMSEMQAKVTDLENLQNEFRNQALALERVETERLELAQKLHENYEKMESITKERNDLKELQESFEIEKKQLKEYAREMESAGLQTKEQLNIAHANLKEYQEIIKELRGSISEKEAQASSTQDTGKTNPASQGETPVPREQELLPDAEEARASAEKGSELEPVEEHSRTAHSLTTEGIEMEILALTKKLEESQKEISCLTKERSDLRRTQEALQVECAQLKDDARRTLANHLETEEELSLARCCLKEQENKIDSLIVSLSQKEAELSSVRVQLEVTTGELERKVQELCEKQEQLNIKETSEVQGKMSELDHIRALLLTKDSALQSVESDRLRLNKQLEESQEEIKILIKEREELRRAQEALHVEREQQQESIKEISTRLQELQDKEYEYLVMKSLNETQGNKCEDLNQQLEAQKSSLEKVEMQNVNLTQRLNETLEEMKSVAKERDELRSVEERLTADRDQLKKSLEETITKNQELQEKGHQLSQVKADLRETMDQMEQLKEQLEAQNSTLESIEIEKLKLTQQLNENLKEMTLVAKENDDLKIMDEALREERDQLRESLRQTEASDLEKQEKLRIAHLDLKEHQETIERLMGSVAKRTEEVSDMNMELERANTRLQEKVQELKASELQLLKSKVEAGETKKQLKEQGLALSKIEMENLNLAQQIHQNLEEMKSISKERDDLKRMEEILRMEKDQLKDSLREAKFKAHQNYEETVQYGKGLLCGGEQHCTGRLREKCLRIEKLLKRYSEMANDYECLNRFSLDLEKETKTQKELSVTIKTKLSLPYTQTKEIEKLLTANQRCSMEFHRILKKLKYVLSYITRIKEEQHEFINKFEMAFIQEVEKQNELQIKIQSLSQTSNIPSRDSQSKLSQEMDLHIEEILKDFSENDFLTIKTEVKQVLSNRKEITEFLEKWLNTHFDTENLKSSIQKENKSIGLVNNFYHSKITAMVNESTEFEERCAARAKDLERHLKALTETTEQLSKVYQSLTVSWSIVRPSTQDSKDPRVALEAEQLTSKDKNALGAMPYKEEIEDLKMQLVKIDLEKKAKAKEFEKEMLAIKATVEHQEEVIRLLRENLRRNQQAQDTSMLSEQDSHPLRKPLTCGGGSGIVQSTKALILKSEYKKMESEISKLKQQNEQLRKQKNQLLCDNSQLSKEVKSWEERTLRRDSYREASHENPPKSPAVTGMESKRRQNTASQCKERNFQDPVPKDSPKSSFFDSRSKSLPAPPPIRYFDNSSLGLCPEEPAEIENVDPKANLCQASSGKDVSECKMQ
uniref:Centromere-associated protein E n=2 Tax=Rattus norvegicus TaxID=10116 RepID=D3ZV60_RAT|eukprot:XP_006233412.2 PREDICTED: centromere-associated protein E isoform X1 [Rattus norvegicus]